MDEEYEEWFERQKEYEKWLEAERKQRDKEAELLDKWLKNFKDKGKDAKQDYYDWKYGDYEGS